MEKVLCNVGLQLGTSPWLYPLQIWLESCCFFFSLVLGEIEGTLGLELVNSSSSRIYVSDILFGVLAFVTEEHSELI